MTQHQPVLQRAGKPDQARSMHDDHFSLFVSILIAVFGQTGLTNWRLSEPAVGDGALDF